MTTVGCCKGTSAAEELVRIHSLSFTSPRASAKIAPRRRELSVKEMEHDRRWMEEALLEARRAKDLGEVPVGAVVVRRGEVVGRACNRRETLRDPLAHAELLAIRRAAVAVAGWRLIDCTMYVTLEPCAMCAGALVNSRVERLVFGASDPKAGFCGSLGNLVHDPRLNHRLAVRGGVLEAVCGSILRDFFGDLRGR